MFTVENLKKHYRKKVLFSLLILFTFGQTASMDRLAHLLRYPSFLKSFTLPTITKNEAAALFAGTVLMAFFGKSIYRYIKYITASYPPEQELADLLNDKGQWDAGKASRAAQLVEKITHPNVTCDSGE